MTPTPMTPQEFRQHLALMTVSELEAASSDPVVKACRLYGGEYEAIWREAIALHEALDAINVPSPRVNIGARVMASVARAEQQGAARRPGLLAAVRQALSRPVAVPAWGLAALLAILLISALMNLTGRKGGKEQIANPSPPIVVIDRTHGGSQLVPAAAGVTAPGPAPALIIIMGAPPGFSGSTLTNTPTLPLENSI